MSEQGYSYVMRSDGKKLMVRDNRDRFFYPKEWMAFFDNLREKQKFTFMFLINTGSRINEARNVKVGDIDLVNRRMILRVTKVRAKKKEKNPRPRTIPISKQFTKYLSAFIRNKKLNNEDYFPILSTPGGNMAMKGNTTTGTQGALQRAKIADWYNFSIHNIRKTLETWLMALNVDGIKIIAHIGHSFQVAAGSYLSADVFSWEEKQNIRMIIGDLYSR